MWKAAVLAVCLLLAGVRAMDGPTYGVKLCGREFIRAVIFTCGGSRWRRSITSTGKDISPILYTHYDQTFLPETFLLNLYNSYVELSL